MSASPADSGASDDAADQPARRPSSLTDWLRARSDRQLLRLLTLRPDLGLPTPPDVAALASRAIVRTSTQRAVDALDAYALRTLENLVLAADDADAVEPDTDLADDPGLADLFDRALAWGAPDLVHIVPTVREALGAYPAGLGRPAATLLRQVPDAQLVPVLRNAGIPPVAQPASATAVAALLADPAWVRARLAECDPDERETIERLAAGPPVGSVRNTRAAASGTDLTPAHRLINRGLLVPLDSQRVELPREVGQVVREAAESAPGADPPAVHVTERQPDELDRLGTTAVLEVLRLVDALADSWSAHAPAVLRSGGLGVRDLRRTAKDLDLDEAAAAVVVETAYAAGLVNATTGMEPVFLPTGEYDVWRGRDTAERWLALAGGWLAMTREPRLVGLRDERDRVITALGPDVERGTLPALRRRVFDALAELPPGGSPARREAVLDRLAWFQPRRAAAQRPAIERVLAEADLLGITAAGGLTGYTRTLLAGSAVAAGHALDHALPDPVDHFLVQPDLTVVVPGPPVPAMGVELGLLADLESTGGASVYRITERSVRRALDAGRSGQAVTAFLAAHSRTPLPQGLTYLVDDASRRHGVLRAGTAGAYLRCEDESLLARVVADRATAGLGLRLLAPTVVVATASVTDVLDTLREAGFAPAAESPEGELITLGVEPPRAGPRTPARSVTTRSGGDPQAQAAELVRRIRSGDALAGNDPRVRTIAANTPGVTSASTMETLRTAVREARLIWFGWAEADGSTTAHTLQPISLAAGTVRGYERGRQGLAAYQVHRITAIRLLDEDEDSTGDGPVA